MLRSKEFALHVINLVERTAAAHFASAALMDDTIVTIRDWAEAIEEQKRQQTSAVSVRFAYDVSPMTLSSHLSEPVKTSASPSSAKKKVMRQDTTSV
jgi:hypothetical protein